MSFQLPRPNHFPLALVLALLVATPRAAGAAPGSPPGADFSGTWRLNEALSEDPFEKWQKASGGGHDGGSQTMWRGRGGREGGAWNPGSGPPAAVLENDRRLSVVDDGQRLKITLPTGRTRVLSTDGQETYVDGPDGPTKVTAKRKGLSGERLVVYIELSGGREVKEEWELHSSPRRVVVTTNVGGRNSFKYLRVYDPAPPEIPASTPGHSSVTGSTTTGVESLPAPPPAPSPAVAPAGMKACSVRPPRGASPSDLARLARVGGEEAARRARAAVAPAVPRSVVSSEPEILDGCVVYSFYLRFGDRQGVQEVVIDAGDGKLLTSEFDGPR